MSSCHAAETGYLLRVATGPMDEFGAPAAYVDSHGDTIVEAGKYFHCYTDTLRSFAIVLESSGRCLAIDRDGQELYEVFWVDNGPDPITEGYFRIVREDLIGYADEKGTVVIQPQFACAFPFDGGRAQVTFTCQATPEGEYSRVDSDTWFWIDPKGNRL